MLTIPAVGLTISFCTVAVLGSVAHGAWQQTPMNAHEHADLGRRFAESGDLKSAEAELRRAIELAPDAPAYLGALGAILGMQGKLEESNSFLQRALAIDPDDFATRRNLASNQFQLGQLQPAKENLERLLKANPGDKTVVLLLGMVDEELKDFPSAVRLLGSVKEQVRERPESMAALARAYYQTGQAEKAQAELKEFENHRAGPAAIFLGAQVAAQAMDFATAERMFSSIWSSYPDRAKLGFNLALAQYKANRIAESRATLERLLESGHTTSEVFNLLSWCFHKQGNLKEAVKAMDLAIDRDPSRELNYLDLAMILMEHRRFSVALVAVKKAVEIAPNSYQAYRLKGLAETRLQYYVDAIKSYTRAVELNPASSDALLGLASAQMSEGIIADAEVTFQKGIEQFPREAILYQEYGRMLVLWGGNDAGTEARAVSLLQMAISLDGSLAEAHFQLGKLAQRQGRNEEALQHLTAATKLNPQNRGAHYSLANLYRRIGRNEDASREYDLYESLKAEENKAPSGAAADETGPGISESRPAPAGRVEGPDAH